MNLNKNVATFILLCWFIINSTLPSYACISGPLPQYYFKASYSIAKPQNLIHDIEVNINESDDIHVISKSAYPVYILKKSGNSTEKHFKESIVFPQGYIPIGAIVGKRIYSYNARTKTWKIDRTIADVEPYPPSLFVNLNEFNFRNENIQSLDTNFEPNTPAPEDKEISIWVNSVIYKHKLVKAYMPDPEYKNKVDEQLRIESERIIAQEKFDKTFWGRFIQPILNYFQPRVRNC